MNNYFTSGRLYYRPYELTDADTLLKLRNEESRRRWFYFQEPDILTMDCAVMDIKENIDLWSRELDILKSDIGLAICIKSTDELIGYVSIGKVRCDDVEIGYEIGEKYQNNGYATEAVKAVVEWGFCELSRLNCKLKILGKAEHENISSCRVLEKAGFHLSHKEQYVTVFEIIR